MELDLPFAHVVVPSRRKTVAIHIRARQVELRVPFGVDKTWLESFARDKTPWVLQTLQKQLHHASQQRILRSGLTIHVLGQAYTLELNPAAKNQVVALGNHLHIFSKVDEGQAYLKLLDQWLKKQAAMYMPQKTAEYIQRLQPKRMLTEIRYRKTKSKWGHCDSTGVIQYNWLVMLAPPAVVDYLIAHEVSHLEHMNHSPAFWDCVAQLCPDFNRQRQWLKQHGQQLSLVVD
jgi:predicted metal-dependent hydrolase